MISRFNLDQKRLNFYDDIKKFNSEFFLIESSTNKDDYQFTAVEPTILINKDKTLKITLINKEKEFVYILFANHSLSILPLERIKVHKAAKESTNFEIFALKKE